MGTHPIFESDFDCLTVMNGTDSGGKADLESNEPDPKRLRIDPEISTETTQVHQNSSDVTETLEPDIRVSNAEKETDDIDLEVPNEKYTEKDIEKILHYKVENECKLYIQLKNWGSKQKRGWISHRHVDRIVLVEWLTKLSLNQERKLAPDRAPLSVIQSTNPDSDAENEEILAKEIKINKDCFTFDQDGHPRFVEKILGITKDMGPIEFVVKFKYLRQERLIEAKILNEHVPHIVISYYEERVTLGSEKIHHYKVDNNQII